MVGEASRVPLGRRHGPQRTRANDFSGERSNPQGEKKRASSTNRSMRRTVSNLPSIHARAEASLRLGRCPRPSNDLKRLKHSSICHRAR